MLVVLANRILFCLVLEAWSLTIGLAIGGAILIGAEIAINFSDCSL